MPNVFARLLQAWCYLQVFFSSFYILSSIPVHIKHMPAPHVTWFINISKTILLSSSTRRNPQSIVFLCFCYKNRQLWRVDLSLYQTSYYGARVRLNFSKRRLRRECRNFVEATHAKCSMYTMFRSRKNFNNTNHSWQSKRHRTLPWVEFENNYLAILLSFSMDRSSLTMKMRSNLDRMVLCRSIFSWAVFKSSYLHASSIYMHFRLWILLKRLSDW